MILKVQAIKEKKIDKLDVIKLKIFSASKDAIKSMRRHAAEPVKMVINHISALGLVSRIYKELLQQTTQLENGQRTQTDISQRRWTESTGKDAQVWTVVREM